MFGVRCAAALCGQTLATTELAVLLRDHKPRWALRLEEDSRLQTHRTVASLLPVVGLALLTTVQATPQQRPSEGQLEDLVVRRVLSQNDTDPDNFVAMSPSPDGRQVAYVSMVDGSVHVRDLSTGEVWQLAEGLPAAWHSFPKWSPDRSQLAVATTDQKTGTASIKLIDVATHAVEVVRGTIAREQRIAPMEWSKDGRSLLCCRGDQLVLVSLSDSRITTVRSGVNERQGSLSPDGRFVVYAAHAVGALRVFISPVTGGTPRLVNALGASGGNPMWSPNGDAIAYESDNGIWVVSVKEGVATGAPRHVVVTSGITLQGWTERGLYFTAWGETKQVPYQIPMNPATGESVGSEPEPLPGGYPDEWFGRFTWSPDMQRVAFVHWHPAAVSIYSTSGGRIGRFEVSKLGYVELPSWSADGREVLVHVLTLRVPGTDTVRALDPGTGRVRDVEPQVPNGFYASYSADGRTVAFARLATSLPKKWKIGELVVAETGATEGLVVATGDDVGGPIINDPGPRLSPRGDKVMYVRHDRQNKPPSPATLWIVNSDGRSTRQLATAARFRSTTWDPSGQFVAYTALGGTADSSAAELRVLQVETGADFRIALPTAFPGDIAVSDWSRDGRLLGIIATTQSRSNEYWVAQGLVEGE